MLNSFNPKCIKILIKQVENSFKQGKLKKKMSECLEIKHNHVNYKLNG